MIRKLSALLILAIALLSSIAGGCAKAANTTSNSPPSIPALTDISLSGTSWNLVSYGDPASLQTVIAGTHPTLAFNADTTHVSGTGGVNGFGGDCKRTDNQLTVSQLIQTEIASTDPAINAQENAYFRLLLKAQSVSFGFGVDGMTINCEGAQALNFTAGANPVPIVPTGTSGAPSTGTSSPVTNSVPTPPATGVSSGSANSTTVTTVTLTMTAVPPSSK